MLVCESKEGRRLEQLAEIHGCICFTRLHVREEEENWSFLVLELQWQNRKFNQNI